MTETRRRIPSRRRSRRRTPSVGGPARPGVADAPPGHRLDPDRPRPRPSIGSEPTPAPAIDTRPYRWTIGIFGLVLVLGFSVYTFVTHGVGTAGVARGPATALLRRPAGHLDPQRGRQRAPALRPRPPQSAGAERLRAQAVGAGSVRHRLGRLRAPDRHAPEGLARVFAPPRSSPPWRSRRATARLRPWSARTAGRSRSPMTATVRSGSLYGVAICPMVELAEPWRGGRRPADRQSLDLRRRRWPPGPRDAGRALMDGGRAFRRRRLRRSRVARRVPRTAAQLADSGLPPVRQPARGPSAPQLPLQPLPRRECGGDAYPADPPRVPIVLPPGRARSRRHAHPQRAGRGGPVAARAVSLPEPDRRCRPDCRGRDRRPGVGARRRCRRRPAVWGSA